MEPHGPLGSSAKCILGPLDVRRGGRVGRRQPPAKRLQGQNLCPGFESRPLRHAPLAQVDRASDYESEGQRFESSRAHHQNPPRPPGVLGRLLTPPSGDSLRRYEQEHAATLWEICSRGSSARYFQRCLDCTTSESRTATVAATAAGQPGGHPDLPKVWVPPPGRRRKRSSTSA